MPSHRTPRRPFAVPSSEPRPSAGRTAYLLTKELIISGDLPGGTLISEGEIAERTGLSRTPVREAFLRLEAEDLLRLHPKRGAVVVPISPEEAGDVLELRRALECSAAERIARRGLAAQAGDALRELIARQRECAARRDVVGYVEVDVAFHAGIVEAAGNALSSRFYRTLTDRQRRMNVHVLGPRAERLDVLADEHEALLGLLGAGDAAGFATALEAHLIATHGRA